MTPAPDWTDLLEETRAVLQLDAGEPVPVEELVETAVDHGYGLDAEGRAPSEAVRRALRDADTLVATDDVDHVRLADDPDDAARRTDYCSLTLETREREPTDETPLDQYRHKGYVQGDTREETALDAAVALTASSWGPPHDSEVCNDTDPWGEESYRCACTAVEDAIAEALLAGGENTETPDSGDIEPRGHRNEDDDPRGETGETGEDDTADVDTPADGVAVGGEATYPGPLTDREYWVTWILDGHDRKRPVAPWQSGHAYPAKWAEGLDEEERPETAFEEARRWAEFDLGDAGLALPEDAKSDELRLGIILPADRPPREERVTLIDWDDVRDPETGEIHPVAGEYIAEYGGYVEVSRSGEGLHQYVLGGLRKRGKFIAPIDEEPFVGDDLPQVEVYDGGRHVAMTGEHVVGTDADAVEGQGLIDAIVSEYAGAEKDAGHRTYDPETGETDDTAAEGGSAEHVPDPETGEYTGPDLETLQATKPEDRSLDYHVAVETFYRGGGNSGNTDEEEEGYANIQNWRLEGFAAALGEREGLDADEVKADLGGEYLDDTDVPCRCVHRTPERVDYGYERARSGRLEAPSYSTLVEYGVLPPAVTEDDDADEYDDDPREVSATVDLHRAWDAAGRVTPADLETDTLDPADEDAFACPTCGSAVDVVRAVAVREGLAECCDGALDADTYPEAYARARTDYGAPLPEYYTTADAIAEFDAVLDVIGEVGFDHLDFDAIASDITATGDEVGGDAVAAMNPAWRLSESGESVLVFDSGVVWDADTERVLDALRFVALDSGLLADATEPLEGETFTEAYRRARTDYGAPLPRWEPALDGARDLTPQLPPAEDLLDARDVDGVGVDDLEAAREDVEALIREAAGDADTPTVVTALPALGKTTGTIKAARDHPTSYLAPRKELQQQALDKADEWGVDAFVLPVFADDRVREQVLDAATAYVREHDKTPLRERWSLLEAAVDGADEDVDPADIFDTDDDEDDREEVSLDRATCPTADGEHGVAWALAVHVARRLGYTPRQIHAQARGLFGADLPCEHDHDHGDDGGEDADSGACAYSEAWEEARSPEDPYDLLVGSYTHAHVESVRTTYSTGPDGDTERNARTVVLDEFVGEAYAHGFGDHADDHARWLASALRADVSDRRDMYEADLFGDEWVRAWLDGEGEAVDSVDDALATLGRLGDLFDARDGAETVLDEVDPDLLDTFDLEAPLAQLVGGDDPADVGRDLTRALGSVDRHHPGAGVAEWVADAVAEPLERATGGAEGVPDVDTVDLEALPIAGDLADLVAGAVEAVAEGTDDAEGRLRAAVKALRGGREGCEVLAAWADDGYAHPDAHHLLEAIATPTGADAPENATRVETDAWAFDDSATDGTTVDVVETGARATVVLDRNGHGARLHNPPARTHAGGEETPLVGLDATGRAELWRVALGEPVETADIHDTPAERAAFLEDALDLRVLRAADRPRYYSGDPGTKDTDGDAALLEAIAEEYSGIDAPRQRGDTPEAVGRPAAITSKGVREVLENDSRLDDAVSAWEHFGNLAGANDLGDHRLGAVLGCQHFGDDKIERFAALDGEAVDVSRDRGRGAELSYDSDLGDEYLQHMTEDQVLQAILRFARGDSGATVVARTGALSPDLPVVGEGQVVETWSDTATAIARRYRRLGDRFTVADVADAVDVSRRHVRRVLTELAKAGYVDRVSAGDGVATVYAPGDTPGAGEVDLAAREDAVDATAGRDASKEYYTWNVRVAGGETAPEAGSPAPSTRPVGAPPAPEAVEASGPPG